MVVVMEGTLWPRAKVWNTSILGNPNLQICLDSGKLELDRSGDMQAPLGYAMQSMIFFKLFKRLNKQTL